MQIENQKFQSRIKIVGVYFTKQSFQAATFQLTVQLGVENEAEIFLHFSIFQIFFDFSNAIRTYTKLASTRVCVAAYNSKKTTMVITTPYCIWAI